MSFYPYAERYGVNRTMPETGRSRDEVLAELREMATEEDAVWETGKISGSMYCGDHDHYDFLNEAFGLYAHVNALQRDICPSATRFEGEIIAMTLDMLHAEAVDDGTPVGLVTSGGTGSITHAMLAYRERARQEGRTGRLNVIKPETAHPAFDKALHLFDMELRRAPVDPDTTLVDVDWVSDNIDDGTVALIGSACTSTAASAASSSPGARNWATPSPPSTSACPASPASRPTPTSTATPSRARRRCCSGTRPGATRSTST